MNNLGYGDNIPINVNKSHKRNFIVRCFSILVLLFACAFLGYCVFNSQNNVNVSNMLCVYADSYSQPDTWVQKTWNNSSSLTYGDYIWSDGVNYYYSDGLDQFVLDVSTSTWSAKTWNGLTNFSSNDIWTDGANFYYSNGTDQYVLDVPTSTWSAKTWNGSISTPLSSAIWSDGNNIYSSFFGSNYVLDVSTSTWSAKTWNGLTSFLGSGVWTDGVNYYWGDGSDIGQYVLDISTSTWSAKTWNGYSYITGDYIWSDGVNYYLSNGSSDQYVLDVSTSTWSAKTWNGLADFWKSDIFTVDGIIYFYAEDWQSGLVSSYMLVQDVSVPDVPAFTATQFYYFIDLQFDSNLDSLSNYNNLILTFSVSDTSFNDVDLFISMTSSQLAHFGSFSNKFRIVVPFKFVRISMYDLTDITNSYSVDFTYSSFSWPALSFDILTLENSHYIFNIISSFGSKSGINFIDVPTFAGDNGNVLVCDIYTIAGNLFLTMNDSWTGYDRYNNYFSCVLEDTELVNDVSFRAQFRFVDTDNTSVYYRVMGNSSTLQSGFTINYYDFFTLINVPIVTGYSDSFFVPYTLDPPVLTLSDYNVLSWNNVAGASYYYVVHDNTIIENHWVGTSYTISSLGDYYVVAYSNEITIPPVNSNTITVTSSVLDTPVISLSYANITWDSVDNTGYYVLYILDTTDNEYHIVATNITSTGYTVITTGTYVVRAVSDSVFFTDSSLSNSVYFEGIWTPGGSSTNSFAGLIGAVVDTPVHYIVSFLDFDMDFLGFNMLNLVMTLFTLCAVIFVVKFILGRTGKKGD